MARKRTQSLPLVYPGLLSLAFSKNFRNRNYQTTQVDKEWNEISGCFGNKNPLLLRYECKLLERNSERVRWTSGE